MGVNGEVAVFMSEAPPDNGRAVQPSVRDHAGDIVVTVTTDGDLRVLDGAVPHWLERVVQISGEQISAPRQDNAARLDAAVRAALSQVSLSPFKLCAGDDEWIFATVASTLASDGARLRFKFMHPTERRLPEASCLRVWFGLSKTEAAIALELAAGGDVAQIAKARSLSELTVRTHLRTIFDKTHAHSQRDLVALILCVAAL